MSRIGKCIETESRLGLPGLGEQGTGTVSFLGDRMFWN